MIKYRIDNTEFDTPTEVVEYIIDDDYFTGDEFDEYLDGSYGDRHGEIDICGRRYSAAEALRAIDESAYNEYFWEWKDNELYEQRMEMLPEIEELIPGECQEFNGYEVHCFDTDEEKYDIDAINDLFNV